MPFARKLCLVLSLLLALSFPLVAADSVQPPFGLEWEVCSRELDAQLAKAKAKVVERKRTVDGEIWTVESLPQNSLRRAVFTLRDDALAEVELQYGADDWDIWMFDEFMHRVKQGLESKYGAGRQIARKREEGAEVLQTLVGYSWKKPGRLLELVYFGAQNETELLRVVSLHYKMVTDSTSTAAVAKH